MNQIEIGSFSLIILYPCINQYMELPKLLQVTILGLTIVQTYVLGLYNSSSDFEISNIMGYKQPSVGYSDLIGFKYYFVLCNANREYSNDEVYNIISFRDMSHEYNTFAFNKGIKRGSGIIYEFYIEAGKYLRYCIARHS